MPVPEEKEECVGGDSEEGGKDGGEEVAGCSGGVSVWG
jgi:hypothetical protein